MTENNRQRSIFVLIEILMTLLIIIGIFLPWGNLIDVNGARMTVYGKNVYLVPLLFPLIPISYFYTLLRDRLKRNSLIFIGIFSLLITIINLFMLNKIITDFYSQIKNAQGILVPIKTVQLGVGMYLIILASISLIILALFHPFDRE